MKLIPFKVVGVFFLLVVAFVLGFAIQDYFHERGEREREARLQEQISRGVPTDRNVDPYVLDLSGQGLNQVPDFVYQRPPITHLLLANNNYASLPEEIGGLDALRVFDVRTNQLSELPSQIDQMSLVDLNASENQLTSIPSSIGTIESLLYADFANNQITDIPESITNLQDLKWLNLEGNPLDEADIIELRDEMPSTIINF